MVNITVQLMGSTRKLSLEVAEDIMVRFLCHRKLAAAA